MKSFPQVDTSARQRGFEIRVFPLLGELPMAIEPHLSVCQLYRWQLGPNMWSSPTTKSLDPIVATALRVGFPGESHGPSTCGYVCNSPEPEAWTTKALGLKLQQATIKYTQLFKKTIQLLDFLTKMLNHTCNMTHSVILCHLAANLVKLMG